MLQDAEYRALQEQVHLLQELTKHPGWDELRAIVENLTEGPRKKVTNGLCQSHEDYLRTAWQNVGMYKVFDLPKVTFAALEEERKQRVEAGVPTE